MSDVLRVFSKLNLIEPSKLSVSLVEVSPHLSQVQEKKLCNSRTQPIDETDTSNRHYKEAQTLYGSPVRWYRNLSDVPHSFSLFLAHEFFDALPVHKLVINEQGCHEVLVDLNPDECTLRYVLSRNRTPASIYIQVILLSY